MYRDHFAATTDLRATPEQWARAMFGDVPSAGEFLIWRILLQLRITREPSPSTVAGWRIVETAEDHIRLEAESWHLHATLVVRTGDGQVSLETLIRYRKPAGRLVWSLASPVHRRLAPPGLRDSVARMSRRVG